MFSKQIVEQLFQTNLLDKKMIYVKVFIQNVDSREVQ